MNYTGLPVKRFFCCQVGTKHGYQVGTKHGYQIGSRKPEENEE